MVVRMGGIGRAAEHLRVTQPAVSKTIRELEAHLGTTLLDRSRRTVTPTRFGEIFLRHAEAALDTLAEGARSIREAKSPGAGALRIGALPSVSSRLLPLAVMRFLGEGLGSNPRVVTGPNHYLFEQLREGKLDLLLGRMAEPDEMDALVFEPLYFDALCLAVRPGHPLLDTPGFELADILGYEVLVPPPGAAIRAAVDRLFVAAGLKEPSRIIETVSPSFGRSFLRTTNAVWITSRGVVQGDVSDNALALLPADVSSTVGAVGITRKKGVRKNVAVEIFIGILKELSSGRST